MTNEKNYLGEAVSILGLQDIIQNLVGIRMKAMCLLGKCQTGGSRLELAAEELDDAIEMLRTAEVSLGAALLNMIIAHATLKNDMEKQDMEKQDAADADDQ